jgi:hypothetical protein
MSAEVIPHPQQHRRCVRCAQWRLEREGSMIEPAPGIVGGMAAKLRGRAGQAPVRFICLDCQYTLRSRRILGWMALAVILILMLVSKECGLW